MLPVIGAEGGSQYLRSLGDEFIIDMCVIIRPASPLKKHHGESVDRQLLGNHSPAGTGTYHYGIDMLLGHGCSA